MTTEEVAKTDAELEKHLKRYKTLTGKDLPLEDPYQLLKEVQKIRASLDALVVYSVYRKGLRERHDAP